jgi:hypothetical protein
MCNASLAARRTRHPTAHPQHEVVWRTHGRVFTRPPPPLPCLDTRATHTHPVANTSHGRSGANDCTQR